MKPKIELQLDETEIIGLANFLEHVAHFNLITPEVLDPLGEMVKLTVARHPERTKETLEVFTKIVNLVHSAARFEEQILCWNKFREVADSY